MRQRPGGGWVSSRASRFLQEEDVSAPSHLRRHLLSEEAQRPENEFSRDAPAHVGLYDDARKSERLLEELEPLAHDLGRAVGEPVAQEVIMAYL